jgi:TolB-like protein
LPFENLSEEKANAYFADGIQDEILTKLASVSDLKVTSPLSTAKYQADQKTAARELGGGHCAWRQRVKGCSEVALE